VDNFNLTGFLDMLFFIHMDNSATDRKAIILSLAITAKGKFLFFGKSRLVDDKRGNKN